MRFLLLLLVLLLVWHPALGQPDTPKPDLARAIALFTHPVYPPFPDDPSLESPNAAARYIALYRDLDPELARLGRYLESGTTDFVVTENEEGITPKLLKAALEKNQPWIERLIQA